jgi:hypothetical protein
MNFCFAYLLLARIADILVGFEKGSDIDCLSTPDLPVDGPVKRQFQGAPVERPTDRSVNSHLERQQPTHLTAEVGIVLQVSSRVQFRPAGRGKGK